MVAAAAETMPLSPEGPWLAHRSWAVGIDLGQSIDPSAICAVQSIRWNFTPEFERDHRVQKGTHAGRWGSSYAEEIAAGKPKDALNIRALERLPLGLSYPSQAEVIASRLQRAELVDAEVMVDATGVGRPVTDLLRNAGVKHTPVLITGGAEEGGDNRFLHVPKMMLVSQLQAALHSGELKIAAGLPEAKAFTRELQEFRASWTEAGHLRFGARQGAHDDLVLSAALAVHGAVRHRRHRVNVRSLLT
jgi:hypothetical protein